MWGRGCAELWVLLDPLGAARTCPHGHGWEVCAELNLP